MLYSKECTIETIVLIKIMNNCYIAKNVHCTMETTVFIKIKNNCLAKNIQWKR